MLTSDTYLTDNTNADIDTRLHWVKIAREFSVPIRCVRFTASSHLAEHNDAVRAMNPNIVCIILGANRIFADNRRPSLGLEA